MKSIAVLSAVVLALATASSCAEPCDSPAGMFEPVSFEDRGGNCRENEVAAIRAHFYQPQTSFDHCGLEPYANASKGDVRSGECDWSYETYEAVIDADTRVNDIIVKGSSHGCCTKHNIAITQKRVP